MSLSRKLCAGLLLLCLIVGFWGASHAAHAESEVPPLEPQALQGTLDSYGYVMSSSTIANTGWIDATGGTLVVFTDRDDGYNNNQDGQGNPAPISLGFSFPYYEAAYSGVFVSTNGKVTMEGVSVPSNEPMPRPTPPNTIIAPFWDDLYIGGPTGTINQGNVYYLRGGSAPNRFFVVQWHQVSRLSEGANKLTFEVILHENGRIDFRYLDLNGGLTDCSVGIEDGDGVDGVQFVYNAPGLSEGLALSFTRPAVDWRVKMVTTYNSALIDDGVVRVRFVLRNTGEKGSDTYNLSYTSNQSTWKVTFLGTDASTPLADTDSDGKQDTGLVPQGATVELWAQVRSPLSAPVGSYIQLSVTARSRFNPARFGIVRLDAAVPAPFTFAFSDRSGIRLGYISNHAQTFPEVQTNYTGSALAVEQTPAGGFFYTWEKSITSSFGEPITNVEYASFSRFGRLERNITRVTNHEASTVAVFDLYPASAISSDGRIAIAWLRENIDAQNIFFTVLSPQGVPLFSPVNVTNQVGSDILYGPPLVTETYVGNEAHFILVWTSSSQVSSDKDVWSASFRVNSSNQLVMIHNASAVTNSASSGAEYQDAQLAALSDGRVALVYSKNLSGAESMEVLGLDVNGVRLPGAPVVIPNARGTKKDILQITAGGAIGVAWVDTAVDQIRFSIVNHALTSAQAPVNLDTPNFRNAGEPSLALAPDQRVIVHWIDDRTFGFLYYALMNSAGGIVTPPLAYHHAKAAEALYTSTNGQGVIRMDGFSHNTLPIIRK